MKTVCFVVPSFPTNSETFVVQQIIQAQQNGYHVKVLTNNMLDIKEASQRAILEDSKIMDHVYEVSIKIPNSKFIRRITILFLIIRFFKYWIRLGKMPFRKRFSTKIFKIKFYYQFKKVDVFHVQFAQAGIELPNMVDIGLLKGKIITTFHGYDAHFKNDSEREELKRRYKDLLKVSSFITVNTPYLASKVKKIEVDETKLHIIPMGFDTDLFRNTRKRILPLNNKPVKLLSVGRLVAFKGFNFAIYAIKQVIVKGYNVMFTIVGDGQERDSLKKLIDELDLNAHVVMVGKQSQNEVMHLMQNHDIFIMSSVTDNTGRQETQGVVTAEAQAMGLPVVGFKSGGVPYTVIDQNTGYLVEEKDTNAFAQAIVNILNSPENYQQMSDYASEYAVKEFSNTLMGKRFKMLYY